MKIETLALSRLEKKDYPRSKSIYLVLPNLDAANIALNLVKVMTDALHVGPILLGSAMPAHILTPSVTSRGVVNMTALAAVDRTLMWARGKVVRRARRAGVASSTSPSVASLTTRRRWGDIVARL